MKRIFTYILIMASALFAAVSCSNEALENDPKAPQGELKAFTLRLGTLDPAETKALTGEKIPGEGNENTIQHVDYFFFGDEAGTQLLYSGRLTLDQLTAVEGQDYTYEKEFDITNDYPNIKYGCYAYVVANYPHEITATTLSDIMALPLTADWTQAQTNFVMDTYDTAAGSAVHALTPKTTAEVKTITLPLTRVAAKIQVNLKVAKSYTDNAKNLWKPTVDQFTHQLVRSRKSATLAAMPAAYAAASEAADYLNYASERNVTQNADVTVGEGENAKEYYSYTLAPYYTYPQAFDTEGNTAPYIKFQMQWVNEDKGSNNFYYKFLTPEITTFERNRIYILDAVIDVIGGTEDDWAEVKDYYIYVADWWSPGAISATYESAKYLSVINHTYTIYGDDEIIVPVISSDDIQIVSKTGTKKNLKSGNNVTVTPTVEANGKESFTLTHVLENDVTKELYDCTPITYTVTIQHKAGGLTKQETVTIIQYPNIYVEKIQSNGYVWVNGQGGGGSQVNVTNNNNNGIGVVVQRSTVNGQGDNNNQNNYNIYVSVLPDDSNYVIGDPRVGATVVNNLGNDVTNSYKAAGENTQNVIAPAFKVASSYGKTTSMSFTRARERCASYQESGYPAGRWRLPTEAEVRFAVELSKYGHIPTLFQTEINNGYWTANGAIYSQTANGTLYTTTDPTSDNTNRSVRCVYDIWYWGDAPMPDDGGTVTAQTDENGNVTGYTGAATQWLGYKMD